MGGGRVEEAAEMTEEGGDLKWRGRRDRSG